MSGSGCRSKLSICAARLSRCNANGSPAGGNTVGAVALVGGVGSLKWTADIIAGDKIRDKDGCGGLAVNKRYPDLLAGFDVELDFLIQSYELREIAYGANLLTSGPNVIGAADAVDSACGATAKSGIILEAWGENQLCSGPDSSFPYERRVFSRVFFHASDGAMQIGANHLVLKGYTQSNPNAGDGPFNDWPASLASITNWNTVGFDDTALPVASTNCGYATTPSQS